MGEAKRRRAAAKAAPSYHDARTGSPLNVRMAGDPLAFRAEKERDYAAEFATGRGVARVPCNGCRECCYHKGVDVHPGDERPEDLMHLDLVHREGEGWFLRKREDGACVHLGPDGCTVYQHRPAACRMYDCRSYSLIGMIDTYSEDHQQPMWLFQPTTLEGRIYAFAMQMLGLAEKRSEAGKNLSARDILIRVLSDRDRLTKTLSALTTVATLPPEQQREVFGFDPASVTKEQVMEAMRVMAGDQGVVMVRDD